MSIARRSLLPILLLVPLAASAQMVEADGSASELHTVYPQIVRLSYVEGDVRLARGNKAEKATGDDWDQAVVDVPLQAGFTLATGTGRAEIEFEDASTAYLAPNSVVTFTKLSSKAGLSESEMNLLTGSLTVHLSMLAGERYLVTTPNNTILHDTPGTVFFRIDSYLDGTAVTPLDHETLYTANSPNGEIKAAGPQVRVPSNPGQTAFFSTSGTPILRHNEVAYRKAHAEWDNWVVNRVRSREAALAAVMKQAGLTQPLPGLVELKDQGSFVDCAPYGVCWEPNNGWAPAGDQDSAELPAAASGGVRSLGTTAHLVRASYQAGQVSGSGNSFQGQGQQASGQGAGQAPNKPRVKPLLVTDEDYFPCSPFGVRTVYRRDPMTGILTRLYSEPISGMPGYGWAVCHSGRWIYHGRRLAWVPGRKPIHHPPICWVKAGGKVGYVPAHPRDVEGKAPVNLKNGVFAVSDRKQGTVERLDEVSFVAGRPVEALAQAPREFRKEYVAPLLWVQAPKVETRLLAQAIAQPGRAPSDKRSFELTFNQKTQGFNLASRQELAGGRSNVVSVPLTSHGGAMASGAGTARAAFSSGGSGGGGGAASRGGGGGYSGGGGSSAGGTSHVSGGGSVSSGGGGSSGGSSTSTHH